MLFIVFLSLLVQNIIFLSSAKSKIDKDPDLFEWQYATPETQGMSSRKLDQLKELLEKKGTKKLLIIKNDRIVCEWFASGWEDSTRRHYTASLAKALVGGMSLLLAMNDDYIHPDAAVCHYIPSWKNDGVKSKITVRHLATHTSGVGDAEVSEQRQEEMRKRGLHVHMDIPGWKGQFWRKEPDPFSVSSDSASILFTPGSSYSYSNPGIAMLTYAVTASLKSSSYRNIRKYLEERIFEPLGITNTEYSIGYSKTYHADGLELVPSWGGGEMTANAVARIGRLMLNKGYWQGKKLIEPEIIQQCITYNGTALPENQLDAAFGFIESVRSDSNPIPATTLGWYSNYDGTFEFVPRDAFIGAGAGNQVLLVIPSLDLIVVRFGNDLFDKTKGERFWLGLEKYLFNPIMEAIEEPPYPESDLINKVEFSGEESILRLAEGSDNWPITWADDDNLYTAYGDGWGFDPKTEIKLSLGLAMIEGNPPLINGKNVRSVSGERVGEGKFGLKASGILMVDKTLYMLIRNAKNAQLAWSDDYGSTWTWAPWKFEISFGCPTFLNFGKNYESSKDDYIYIYSHDDRSAYQVADNFILARVHKNEIRNQRSYQFFTGMNSVKPIWSEDIFKRVPVFINPGKCYRSGITYNKALKRYLWCQVIPKEGKGSRFDGGFGIFEALEPWGPWKTVFYTRDYDIGPGETASIPTKWISNDGKECYILFSGDDFFSLRKIKFVLKSDKK